MARSWPVLSLAFAKTKDSGRRFYESRRHIRRQVIEEAIATGELESDTDPELMIDALNGPLCFRGLQRHAALSESFAESIFEKVMPGFQP